MVAKLRKSLLLAMAVGNKSKVVRLESSVRLEVSRESKFEWAYLKLARIGQVSILELKARVSAARFFPHAAPAADSMASSDTSTVRIASSLYGAPLNSFICPLLFYRHRPDSCKNTRAISA
jgi:hypothetical protein